VFKCFVPSLSIPRLPTYPEQDIRYDDCINAVLEKQFLAINTKIDFTLQNYTTITFTTFVLKNIHVQT